MSHLEIIRRLSDMLISAQEIIQAQAELLAMHGIAVDSGDLAEKRQKLLEDIENSV